MAKSNVKFKLNRKGVREVLRGEEIQAVLDQCGERIENIANSNAQDPEAKYSHSVFVGRRRAIAQVRAVDGRGVQENLRNNTLLKAIGQSRGMGGAIKKWVNRRK